MKPSKPIKIVTDSSVDLPADVLKKYDISVVPLAIQFGQETFNEGSPQLTRQEFYRRIEAGVFPRTSQPPAGAYAAIFNELAGEASGILCLTITAAHSGTYNSALMAKEMVPQADIEVIDSAALSMGTGFQALAAARAAAAGKSKEEIMRLVVDLRNRMHHYFCLDTVKYLEMGGRVSHFQSMFASLLNLKPILSVRDGTLSPYERVRTRSKSVDRLVEIVEQKLGAGAPVRLAVLNTQAEAEAERVSNELHRRLNVRESFRGELSLTLTVHAGPGLVGVIGYAIGPDEE